ncbi:hypothetical protein EsH8_III_000462 [Colletotrichum jinshuiense]
MAPGKKPGVPKKNNESSAAASLSSKPRSLKGKVGTLPQKSKVARPIQDAVNVAGQKRPIAVAEEDSDGDVVKKPPKRRKKSGKGPNPHDYYAVRETPPPRQYGATFSRKSTAHYTWGAPISFHSQSQDQPQPNKVLDQKMASVRGKGKGKDMAAHNLSRPRSRAVQDSFPSRATAPKSSGNINEGVSFFRLPIEIRQSIYKCILVAKEPVRVRQGWSAVYPRNRPGIDTSILRVCRQVRNEAINVLYGENTFLYLLRETAQLPATNALGESEIVVQHPLMIDDPQSEYEGNSEDEYSDEDLLPKSRLDQTSEVDIDIRRYGHKFRKLMIVAEPNRTEKGYKLSMANAIAVFRDLRPLRPRVHTITIEITPIRDRHSGEVSFLDFFEKTSEVVRTLKGMPCQFIEIRVNTGGGGQECISLNMKYAANIRRAKRGQEDLWKNDKVMQAYRSTQAGAAQRKLEQLPDMIREIWEGPNRRFMEGRVSDEEDLDDAEYLWGQDYA